MPANMSSPVMTYLWLLLSFSFLVSFVFASDSVTIKVDNNNNSSLNDNNNDSNIAAADGNNTTTTTATTTADSMDFMYFQGIPGTTQTLNGYDAALGDDPICWIGRAAASSQASATNLTTTTFPNPLVEDFVLLGETQLLQHCPNRNSIHVDVPSEHEEQQRLRTLQYYDYTVHVDLDLFELEHAADTILKEDGQKNPPLSKESSVRKQQQKHHLITDNRGPTIAVQVVLCSLGNSGFCSPFVHEQANARDEYEARMSGVARPKGIRGDMHGGTHIHSPWVFLNFENFLGANDTFANASATVQVPMIVNVPGDYYVIATIQLYMGDIETSIPQYRWDMANALEPGHSRVIRYQPPPIILEVSTTVQIISYLIIAIASLILLLLLIQTIINRHHQVFQLSQGDCLIIFLISALIATTGCFLRQPTNDYYCRIGYAITILPIHLMYAITLGRLWRIHAVISPLLQIQEMEDDPLLQGENENQGFFRRMIHMLCGCNCTKPFVSALTWISKLHLCCMPRTNRKSSTNNALRVKVTKLQLLSVIFFFMLPQIILVAFNLAFLPMYREIEFNEDESMGRAMCATHYHFGDYETNHLFNPMWYSFALLLLLVLVLLVVAHSSRDLPSLFNETKAIYSSSLFSIFILFLGGGLIAVTNSPTTSPDVSYLVWLVVTLSITLSSAYKVILPKLKLVWSGEMIIVSKIVSDHQREKRESERKRRSRRNGSTNSSVGGSVTGSVTSKGVHISGFNPYASIRNMFGGNPYHAQQQQLQQQQQKQNLPNQQQNLPNLQSPQKRQEQQPHQPQQQPVNKSSNSDKNKSDDENQSRELGTFSFSQTNTSYSHFSEIEDTTGDDPAIITPADRGFSEIEDTTIQTICDPVVITPAEDNNNEAKDENNPGPAKNNVDLEAGNGNDDKDNKVPSEPKRIVSFDPAVFETDTNNTNGEGGLEKNSRKQEDIMSTASFTSTGTRSTKLSLARAKVTNDATPRQLFLKMLDLQKHLNDVNARIISGIALSSEDWKNITAMTDTLHNTFENEIAFELDDDEVDEEEALLDTSETQDDINVGRVRPALGGGRNNNNNNSPTANLKKMWMSFRI